MNYNVSIPKFETDCFDMPFTFLTKDYLLLHMKSSDYRVELKHEFEKRRNRNASYSLRAYSRDLEVSVTALSQVLNGIRHFSKSSLEKVARNLSWSPLQRKKFIAEKSNRSQSQEEAPGLTKEDILLEDDDFCVISDWWHYAILSLANTKNNSADPKKISETIGITVAEAKSAMARLKRLGYLKIKNRKLISDGRYIQTDRRVASEARLKHQLQHLEIAANALKKTPRDLRESGVDTFSFQINDLAEARTFIQKFRKRFTKKFGRDEGGDAVYSMNIQFYPAERQ